MKTLEDFRNEKIDLQKIHGGGVGGGLTFGTLHHSGSWASLDTQTGEWTYSEDTIFWQDTDEGSFY